MNASKMSPRGLTNLLEAVDEELTTRQLADQLAKWAAGVPRRFAADGAVLGISGLRVQLKIVRALIDAIERRIK